MSGRDPLHGVGVGYNLCLGLFGGTSPLVAIYPVARTSADFVPAHYVMATAILPFVAGLGLSETGAQHAK